MSLLDHTVGHFTHPMGMCAHNSGVHRANEETEAQRDEVICSKSHS